MTPVNQPRLSVIQPNLNLNLLQGSERSERKSENISEPSKPLHRFTQHAISKFFSSSQNGDQNKPFSFSSSHISTPLPPLIRLERIKPGKSVFPSDQRGGKIAHEVQPRSPVILGKGETILNLARKDGEGMKESEIINPKLILDRIKAGEEIFFQNYGVRKISGYPGSPGRFRIERIRPELNQETRNNKQIPEISLKRAHDFKNNTATRHFKRYKEVSIEKVGRDRVNFHPHYPDVVPSLDRVLLPLNYPDPDLRECNEFQEGKLFKPSPVYPRVEENLSLIYPRSEENLSPVYPRSEENLSPVCHRAVENLETRVQGLLDSLLYGIQDRNRELFGDLSANRSISEEQRQISPIPGLTRHFGSDDESYPRREISPIQGVETVQIKTEMVEEDEKEEKEEKEEKKEKEETEDDEIGDLFIAETERENELVGSQEIPFEEGFLVACNSEKFHGLLKTTKLTHKQIAICKDIRRRGKNKIAAQNCRKRKQEHFDRLTLEIEQLRTKKKEQLTLQQNLIRDEKLIKFKLNRISKLISCVSAENSSKRNQPIQPRILVREISPSSR